MERITSRLIESTVNESGVVRAWSQVVMLPTYTIGEEEQNPMFLEKRVYQGSSGAVYPYAIVEKIEDQKSDMPYNALFLENKYIKVMILPELGGRIHMAYDKVMQRHFVYYNQVVKPALVGLLGPWISGGIEFNWPQHHRPSTFLPTDHRIEEHPDASKTVWCSEVERMFRTKGMHGFTLRPDKAYIEIRVQVYNRTPFPQTFLWWANPAVAVNDGYKSIFPPDVHAVYDHGKRDVSNFPIATGIYYKQDYSAGVDISRYKNIPVPTSYMAINSKYDFVGGYDYNIGAGLLHIANHHVSPGKKQWTWGCGDFGKAWDRNLTDEDGPYIELMTGVYTDNQPDFSWLQPYEEKSWTQYFMPYSAVGSVKNATKDLLVGIELEGGVVEIAVYSTGVLENICVELKTEQGLVFCQTTTNTSPEEPLLWQVATDVVAIEELILTVYDSAGKTLIRYQADKPEDKPMPELAKAPKTPQEIESVEQLYLTGLHIEQYRHPTYNPLDYYMEGVRREPTDSRCSNAVGLLLLRRGQFCESESYFRAAINTLVERNPNPSDGQAYYNLGWSLKMQGKYEEAYSALYKSTWNAAWQDSGYMGVAQIDCIRGEWDSALENIERALVRNSRNHKARALKSSILRKQGRTEHALKWIEESLEIDSFNMGCRFEKYLLTQESSDLDQMNDLMRRWSHGYIEYALDFAAAGLYDEGSLLLEQVVDGDRTYPIVLYAMGYFASSKGEKSKALHYYQRAFKLSPKKCFPNRTEEVNILTDAMLLNPQDSKAPYYLGNFWYAMRQYDDAVRCWERSAELDNNFPTVLRNLSLAYYNKMNRKEQAVELIERAFSLDTTDARILMEMDQLYKKNGKPHQKRLSVLESHLDLVEQRDDLCVERITLYNQLGRYSRAKELIASRQFHPWEGGEGKITSQYTLCCTELAKIAIGQQNYQQAIDLLTQTERFPDNLGEGKLSNTQENEIFYYKALAYRAMGDGVAAIENFQLATQGSSEPVQAWFYNDQQPDKIFYQGLAWRALGNEEQAVGRFRKLIAHGQNHLGDQCKIDYFAVSLPDMVIWDDDLNTRNQVHCYYVMALGYSGLGDVSKADHYYEKVRTLDINKQVFRE